MSLLCMFLVMNKLTRTARAQILGLMVEGTSIRAISRLTGASKNTIVKLLEDAGEAFSDYQDRTFRNLTCKRLQVDEIWSFVYAKQRNVAAAKRQDLAHGDAWTWTAIDADFINFIEVGENKLRAVRRPRGHRGKLRGQLISKRVSLPRRIAVAVVGQR